MESSLEAAEMNQVREGGAWFKVVEDRVNGIKGYFIGRNGRTW